MRKWLSALENQRMLENMILTPDFPFALFYFFVCLWLGRMYCTTPYARLTRVVGVNYALFGACSNTLAVDKLHACVYSNSSFIIHCERRASRLHTKLGIALSFRKSFYLIVLIAWSDQGIDLGLVVLPTEITSSRWKNDHQELPEHVILVLPVLLDAKNKP